RRRHGATDARLHRHHGVTHPARVLVGGAVGNRGRVVGHLPHRGRARRGHGHPLALGSLAAQISLAREVAMAPIITLITDFGTADGYVGEMKGVLLSRAPGATIVDITHDIEAQDVDGARLTVARVWRRFPAGTVHLVVVDPGVGSSRAALAVESDRRFLVGPDNGVLSPALLMTGATAVAL